MSYHVTIAIIFWFLTITDISYRPILLISATLQHLETSSILLFFVQIDLTVTKINTGWD